MENIEDLINQIERDLDQGNLNGAAQTCQKALQLAESRGDLKGKAMVFQKLSLIHFSAGNRDKALQLLGEAANIYNNGGFKDLLALCLHDMAIVHTNIGNLEESLKLYQEAYNIMNSIGLGQHQFAVKIQGKILALKMQLGGG
ncbi:MAG: tetratricopeptide repeat protein [Promethearchaeota archaeon]|nr:MAG: tetratricopeptide repeat protein [Candidatus Lokiarchaeota archaeon]